MTLIKQSTARTILVGPVLDEDGAAVTDEVVASILASKNGGAPGALDGSATLVHQHTGHYLLALTTAEADTLGVLELSIDNSVNAMPVRAMNVVPANVFDSLVAGSDKLDSSVVQWLGVAPATTAANLDIALEKGLFADGLVYVDDGCDPGTTWPYGTAPYPTSTIPAGKTIADANGLHRLHCHGSLSLAAAMERYSFVGELHNTDQIDINGQSVEHSTFARLLVTGATGNGAAIGDQTSYSGCSIYTHTNIQGGASDSLVDGACSVRNTGYATFMDCLFGSYAACTLTLQAPTQCDIVNMRGDLTLAGMDGGVCSISMQNGASITINDTCTAGTITITGTGTVVDNSGAGCTVNVTTPEADAVKISGSSTAADNLKAYNDGTRPVLYVSKSGDDANDGSGWGNAFLTIGAAVTAASGGERIIVGPGTFSEAVDLSSLTGIVLELLSGATVTQSSGSTVILGTACTIEGEGTVEQTGTSETQAVYAHTEDDVRAEGLRISSNGKGINLLNCNRPSVRNNQIEASEYGVILHNCKCGRVESNQIVLSGWLACDSLPLRVYYYSTCLCLNNVFRVTIADGDAAHQAIGLFAANHSRITAINNDVHAIVSSGSHAYGVYNFDSSSEITVVGGSYCASAPAESYDLYALGGTIYAKTRYVTAGVESGTIIDLDERAVQNVMDDAVPGSPTADSINERIKAIDELTEADGAGDLADILGYARRLVAGKRHLYVAADSVSEGDLCYMSDGNPPGLDTDGIVQPASAMADEGEESLNQREFARKFVGVAGIREDDDEVNWYDDGTVWCYQGGTIHTFTCPDDTYAVGQLVGVDENPPGSGLLDQTVAKVSNIRCAIGRVVIATTGTSVQVILLGREESIDWEDGRRLDELLDGTSTHNAAAVWAVGTRTLSTFGTLVADIATAVWGAGTRVLSAFGFTVATDAASRTASKATGYATETKQDAARTVLDAVAVDVDGLDGAEMRGTDGAAVAGNAMSLTTAERDAVATALLDLADSIDGKTPREALQYIAAAAAGLISGARTGTETFVGLDKVTARLKATVDASGNRSAIEYDP